MHLNEASRSEIRSAIELLPWEDRLLPPVQARHPVGPTQHSSERVPLVQLTLPSAEECNEILSAGVHQCMSVSIACQYQIPKAQRQRVVGLLRQLWDISQDPVRTSLERRTSLIMFILAPRWCWPAPVCPVGQKLAPHSRPRVVRDRVHLVTQGHWLQVLTKHEDVQVLGAHSESPCSLPPQRPGLITPSRLRRLNSAIAHGSVNHTWKQLWSWGTPGSSPAVQDELLTKLCPLVEDAPPVQCPDWKADDLLARLSDKAWKRTLCSFHEHKASDAIGWTQSLFKQLAECASLASPIQQLVQQIALNQVDSLLSNLVHTSRVVGLHKGDTGSVRPLSLSTVFRKATACCISQAFASEIASFLGTQQYGTGMPHGIAVLAQHLAQEVASHPTWVHVHLDIENAFTAVSRQRALDALAQVAPALAGSQRAWLSTGTFLSVPGGQGSLKWHQCSSGIAQGDPLSSATFGILLQSLCLEWRHQIQGDAPLPPPHSMRSYVDDTILSAPLETAKDMIASWEATLATAHLHLKRAELQVYRPDTDAATLAECLDVSQTACSSEGMIVCGMPLSHYSHNDPLPEEAERAIPVGTADFQLRFLQLKTGAFRAKLACLEAICVNVDVAGIHTSLHLLRTSVLPSVHHLLRGLSVLNTRVWAQHLDTQWHDLLCRLLHIPHHDMVWDLVHAPISYGGFGLLAFTSELSLHSISQCLALRALRHAQGEPCEPWTMKEQAAWALLADDINIPSALHRDEASLQLNGHAHSLCPLRTAWYKLRCPPEAARPSQRLSACQGVVDPAVCLPVSAQLTACLAWWFLPVYASFLHDGAFVAAWRDRMQLGVLQPNARCQYIARSSMQRCGALLDGPGHHCQKCCFSLLQSRHRAVRDWLHKQYQQVRWTSQLEQDITIASGPLAERGADNAPSDLSKRADLVVSPPGQSGLAIEVAITSSPYNQSAALDIQRVLSAKRAAYGLRSGSDSTITGLRFAPFIYHASAGMGPDAQAILWNLAQARCSIDPTASRMTCFMQLAAELSSLVHCHQYAVLSASGAVLL